MRRIPCIHFRNLSNKTSEEVHISESLIANTIQAEAHTHNFYEFFIVRKGDLVHRLNEVDYRQSTGDLCFILPDDIHSFQTLRHGVKAVITNIAFSRELFLSVYRFVIGGRENDFSGTRHWFRPVSLLLKEIDRKIDSLQDTINNPEQKRKMVLRSLLIDIISELGDSQSQRRIRIPDWLIKASEEMKSKENYTQGVHRLVQLSGKSHEHCIRSMKSCYNTTPYAFVNSLRLKAAAKKLVTSENSILSILLDTGFNNVSNFNASFKKFYGQTPRDYRTSMHRFLVAGQSNPGE